MNEIVDNLKKLCDEHEKQLSELRQRINEIEYIPLAKSLVGTCFKYPTGATSYFGFGMTRLVKRKSYVYKRITAYDNEYVIVDTFCIEHPGKVEITFGEKEYVTHFMNKTMVEITQKQYFTAFNRMVKLIFERGKEKS